MSELTKSQEWEKAFLNPAQSKRVRKPRPKNQQELAEEQGSTIPGKNANEQDTGIEFNRATKMSERNSPHKDYAIGIQDLDEAVFYYFNEVIQPFVYQNGDRREVPVIYGNPERWKSTQKDGFYRDKSGRIMLPIIVVQRNSIEKDRSVTAKVDSNQPYLYGSFQTGYNSRNSYNAFNLINNRIPVKNYEAVVVPDFVTLNYSCIIQTYYMEQLNKLVESMEYASDSYWGNPERYKFRAFIDSFQTATELTEGEERLVRGTFDIRLRGHIIPETIQKELNSAKRFNSKAKVRITAETVSQIPE